MDTQRHELFLKSFRVHDRQTVVNFRMPHLELIELPARIVAQVQSKVIDIVENILACVL